MSVRRWGEPVVLGVGLVVGLGLLAFGLSRTSLFAPSSEPAPEEEGSALAPIARPASGALVWTADATSTSAPSAAGGGAACPGCDIVLITVCSLRQDYVGAYGVHPGLTPRIDSLAAGGARFNRAYAASNFTLAGLSAILTGRFGSTTGVTGWDKGLVEDVPTLPEALGHYGYLTAAFTIDAPSGFRPDYGLHRGFSRMEIIPPPRDTPDGRRISGPVDGGGASARPVATWLAAQPADKPVFAMFHSRTAHFPFVLAPPEPGTDPTGVLQGLWDAGSAKPAKGQAMPGAAGGTAQRGVVALAGQDPLQGIMNAAGAEGDAAWRQAYAEAVTRMDIDVGVVLDAVAARGRPTIVALVADHGESLNDHGELLHGDAYWDTVVRVPLLLSVPGAAPLVEDALVSHVDLAPTLLELVGAVSPAGIDGTSLVPLLRGTVDSVRGTTLVEGGVAWRDSTIPRGAVIAPPWALLRQDRGCDSTGAPRAPGEPASCLYDLDADAPQRANRAGQHPEVITDLLGRWDGFRAARAGEAKQLELDPAYIEALHRTGYDFRVGATGSGAE
ncbi:MAG: sulfatase [Pseudomonadota bacterium]|nr:sulfatase [Pseudomonadota bacterium]